MLIFRPTKLSILAFQAIAALSVIIQLCLIFTVPPLSPLSLLSNDDGSRHRFSSSFSTSSSSVLNHGRIRRKQSNKLNQRGRPGKIDSIEDKRNSGGSRVITKARSQLSSSSRLSPACHPHSRVTSGLGNYSSKAIFFSNSTPDSFSSDGNHDINGGAGLLSSSSTLLPITRIYFYHIRKAGGTMLRKYLKKVASHYGIHLEMHEHKYAKEEPGSHPHTLYLTNLRDPVERSISHFKYEGRWDCRQLVKNESFTPTLQNAKKFTDWTETNGFTPSPCDAPFSFLGCAVNCYIQSFSGIGCTNTTWQHEYALALRRLYNYNLIFVYERFRDVRYVEAIQNFFGVDGLIKNSTMWCGPEAHDANKVHPLVVGFESVLKLSRLNEMDSKFYKEVTDCWEYEEGSDQDKDDAPDTAGFHKKDRGIKYAFPKINLTRFVAQRNRTLIE